MDFIVILIVSIITFFIGLLVGLGSKFVSDKSYDGKMVVTIKEDGTKRFSLELDGDPHDLETKESIRFKVVPE